jgi:hypothetical protein
MYIFDSFLNLIKCIKEGYWIIVLMNVLEFSYDISSSVEVTVESLTRKGIRNDRRYQRGNQ